MTQKNIVPKAPLILAGITLLVLAGGLSNLSISGDASSAMLPDDPLFQDRYADYLSRFPSDHVVVVVTENLLCLEGGWDLILEIDDEISAHEIVDSTSSLASHSTRYLEATPDSIDLKRFRELDFGSPREVCETALAYAPYSGLIDRDFNTATYVIFKDGVDAVEIANVMEELISPFENLALEIGGVILVSGEPIMSAEVSAMVARDNFFVGFTLLAMLVAIWILTKSLSSVVTTFALTAFTVVGAYGAMGWLDIALTPATSLAVFLLIPLSAAVCIYVRWHVYSNQQSSAPQPKSKQAFILAGTTTAIGFSSTGLTDALDIQYLALLGAIGVILLTVGVYLIAFPLLQARISDKAFGVAVAPPIRLISNSRFCVTVFLIFVGFISYGLSNLSINYSPTNYIPNTNEVRGDFDRIGKSFGRMALPFIVETDNAENPIAWKTLAPLIIQLKKEYQVGFEAAWFYDHMSEVTKGFTLDDDGSQVEFPQDVETMSQLILLFDPEDLRFFVDSDRERILVVFHVPFEGSAEYYQFKGVVDSFLEENDMTGYFVGRVSAFFEAGHSIGFDTLRGLSIGAVLVLILMWILLRSLKLALIGVLTNAIPVLLAVGALGALDINLDLGSSIVAAVAFGIILDDTAHLIFRMRELMRSGYDSATAVLVAVSGLSTPIFATTCIVSVGFACLFFAEMIPFGDFATVILVAMWGALVTDLLLLPFFVRIAFNKNSFAA